jgi:hypothetical protein
VRHTTIRWFVIKYRREDRHVQTISVPHAPQTAHKKRSSVLKSDRRVAYRQLTINKPGRWGIMAGHIAAGRGVGIKVRCRGLTRKNYIRGECWLIPAQVDKQQVCLFGIFLSMNSASDATCS